MLSNRGTSPYADQIAHKVFLNASELPLSLFPVKNDPNSNIVKLWELLCEPFMHVYLQIQELYQIWGKNIDQHHPLQELFPSAIKHIIAYPQYQRLILQAAASSPSIASVHAVLSEITQIDSFKISDTTHSVLLDSFKVLDQSWSLSPGKQTSAVHIEAVVHPRVEDIRPLIQWIALRMSVPGIPIFITLSLLGEQHDSS